MFVLNLRFQYYMMKKLLFACAIFILPSLLLAQSKTYNLDWQEAKAMSPVLEKLPYFTSVQYQRETLLPILSLRVDVNQSQTPIVSSLEWENLPSNQIALIRELDIPEKNSSLFKRSSSDFGILEIVTLKKENGQLKRLRAVSYSLKSSSESRPESLRNKTSSVDNSILSTGDWLKVAISNTGVHKLTPTFLEENGLNINGQLIDNIQVYGNGVGILPERISISRPEDILEVPIQVIDANNDGFFNSNDYILFYAKGPQQWILNQSDSSFRHVQNIYRDLNYYFVALNNTTSKKIPTVPSSSLTTTKVVTTFDDYAFREDETLNLVGTGRLWVGDLFDFTLQRNYGFSFPNVETTSEARFRLRVYGRASSSNTEFSTTLDGNVILSNPISQHGTASQSEFATLSDRSTAFFPSRDNQTFSVSYNNSSNPSGVGWLDFIEVQVRRKLIYRAGGLAFRDIKSVGANEVLEYKISQSPSNVQIWDVTDAHNIELIQSNISNNELTFKREGDVLREYIAIRPSSSFDLPESAGLIPNQNIRGEDVPEMVIVTHPDFISASNRLADFHRTNDGMEVLVVTTDQVYNEFSSGGQDISAIRDMMRMFYQKAQLANKPLNYLLLMGDASYDYKDRIPNNSNYVPIWEGTSSLSLYNSSISDDYYAYLDDNEGGSLSGFIMDLGVGRIPVETASQANAYVEKVINYVTGPKRFGDWRSKLLFLADDADEFWEDTFSISSESLEKKAKSSNPCLNVDKVYMDAYTQISSSGSQSYPEARDDMYRKIENGNLVTNYIGHGGEIGLSSERLIQLNDVNSWTNFDNLPLFITITCEFTRLDDPKRRSAGEQLLTNANGGSIALISTTRVVNAGPAIQLNNTIYDTLFTRPNGQPQTFGEIIRAAKNSPGLLNDATKLKFSLFGDPAVRLGVPFNNVKTLSLNGQPIASVAKDTLKALSKVEIQGEVQDLNNQKMQSFNGVMSVSIFDKPSRRNTLLNDGWGDTVNFLLQNNLLYRGKVEVVNGDFSVNFIVPKDISYRFDNGKFSFYAYNDTIDAAGCDESAIVGGFNNNSEIDEIGPEVELYMNDQSFVRGGLTGPSPDLFAILVDSSGINTVGNGIGHDLVAILDGNIDQQFVVNEYYQADLNSFQSGQLRYPFFDLEAGEHTLKLKVFDVHNNLSEVETEFIVAEDEELVIRQLLNYPNPFTTYTEFQFEHNRVGQILDVQVQVFTVSGKLVKTINTSVVSTGNRVTGISWNGLDDYGDKIGKGVYVYKLSVRSSADNATAEEYEKLVILR